MPIRDITIVSIVLILAILALRRPWIGVMNWTWLSIMNPHRYAFGFAYSAPVAAIAAASTLVGLLLTKEKRSPFQGAPTVWLFLFSIWMTLSWLAGYNAAGDYEQWEKIVKIYLMVFVALALLHSKHHIMAFAWVTVGSLVFLAAKGGLFTILTGGSYRVWGPSGSFISDNNHFALATIISIPMLHFLQLQLNKPWHRHAMSLVILLCVAAALGSHSRGAFLALAAMGVTFWWRSSRKTPIALMIFFSLLVMLPLMPAEWWDRMSTINEYQQDASAMGRINSWLVAIEVAKHNLMGAGMTYSHQIFFTTYGTYETIPRAAHSIYFQVLGNHGFIGLFFYLMIWFSAYRMAGQLRKRARQNSDTRWTSDLAAMVQVSLIGFAAGGAFLSMPYFDLPYNLMVMVVLARDWVNRRAWEIEPKISFFEYAGFGRKKKTPTSFDSKQGSA